LIVLSRCQQEAQTAKIRIGPFEDLEIYVADPYGFAMSKLDHSFFDTDFDDIIFLIRQNLSS